jgi:hypothetical protein
VYFVTRKAFLNSLLLFGKRILIFQIYFHKLYLNKLNSNSNWRNSMEITMLEKEHTSMNRFVVFKSKFYNNKMLIQFMSALILHQLRLIKRK